MPQMLFQGILMMWKWLSRVLIAGWFVGMVVLAVVNRPQVEAEDSGAAALYLPLIHTNTPDDILHEYMGLVRGCTYLHSCYSSLNGNFYTVRGNGAEWGPLVEDAWTSFYAWSPDGFHFVYTKPRLENGEETLFTWLIPLATREARPLLQGAYALRWSPDSQRLALINPTHLYIFEVATQQITTILLPINDGTVPTDNTMVWAEDSQRLAWRAGRNVWVWSGTGSTPSLVYEGGSAADELYWSPDGSQLLINSWQLMTNTHALYQSNSAGAPATFLLDGYRMEGWADGNQRIVLWRESRLYIAFPNGGSNYLYFNNALVNQGYIFPSPIGNWVAMGTSEGLFLKPVPDGTHIQIPDCSGAAWREDGARFACVRSWFPMTRIGDVRGESPIITEDLDMYGDPQFLTESDTLISLNKYYMSYSGGYPHPKYESTQLHLMGTSYFKVIRSPANETFPVMEWRHMP